MGKKKGCFLTESILRETNRSKRWIGTEDSGPIENGNVPSLCVGEFTETHPVSSGISGPEVRKLFF